jgi:hypothetical protein
MGVGGYQEAAVATSKRRNSEYVALCRVLALGVSSAGAEPFHLAERHRSVQELGAKGACEPEKYQYGVSTHAAVSSRDERWTNLAVAKTSDTRQRDRTGQCNVVNRPVDRKNLCNQLLLHSLFESVHVASAVTVQQRRNSLRRNSTLDHPLFTPTHTSAVRTSCSLLANPSTASQRSPYLLSGLSRGEAMACLGGLHLLGGLVARLQLHANLQRLHPICTRHPPIKTRLNSQAPPRPHTCACGTQ